MTTLRRPTSTTFDPATRAEAVRARRRQQTPTRPPSASRTVKQIRSAVEQATPIGVRTPRRAVSAPRAVRRPSGWNAAMPRSGRLMRTAIAPPRVAFSWRMASLSIVLLLGGLMARIMSSPNYFINSISLAGSQYVSGEDIYQAAGVDHLSIFWIDPAAIKKNIEALPGLKSAYVEVHWPNTIYVEVKENQPVLAWSQGGQTMWVDAEGIVFPARGTVDGLLPIMVDDVSTALTADARIPKAAIDGALQLKQLRPNIELLHYDSVNGLSYQDGRNWRGYFGVGTDMEVKLAVYETLVADLLSRGIHPSMISVIDKDAPYYRR
jgi:cell division protein FtsQ